MINSCSLRIKSTKNLNLCDYCEGFIAELFINIKVGKAFFGGFETEARNTIKLTTNKIQVYNEVNKNKIMLCPKFNSKKN